MSLSFATASNQGKLEVWNAEAADAAPRAVYDIGGVVPLEMHSLPRHDALLLAAINGEVCLLSLITGTLRYLFRCPGLTAIALAQDAQRVAIGTQYGDGLIRNLPEPFGVTKRSISFRHHTGPITCLVFSPDDELLLAGSTDQLLHVLDGCSGKSLQCCEDHNSVVTCCEFTDKMQIISGSGLNEGKCRLWDRETGGELVSTYGHPPGIQSLALSYSNSCVFFGTADGRIQRWDYQRKYAVNSTLLEDDVPINKLWLAFNGEYLLASCANGAVHKVNTDKLISEYRWFTGGAVSSTLI